MAQSIFFDVIARDRASSTFSKIGGASDRAHNRLLRFSRTAIGAAAGFTSITLAAGAFIRVGADYVGSLNKVQALTGANDATMKRAAKTLESQSSTYAKMGQTVGDAAGGVVELTKAGLSLDKGLKAVNATMVLAKAGQLSVADASNLVANTLNTFGLKAQRAGDIANYLANAANISSADVSDLAESFKYVAPVAASTGVSLKQTNAILAELSNSGIAASNAGTGFRKFLLSLQAPSGAAAKDLNALGVEIFNAQGKMKPLGTVIDILNQKLGKLTDQQRQKVLKDVFGLQGVSAAQVILKNGSKGLDEYTKGVGKAGAAQKLAQAASKGFAGTLAALRSEIISDAQAAYRKLSPAFDDAAKKVLAFIQQMKSGKGAGGDFADALKSIADIGKTALRILDAIPGPIKRFGIEGLIAYAAIKKLQSATSGFGSSLASPIARTKQFYAELTYAETRAGALSRASAVAQGAIRNLAGAGGMMMLAASSSASNKSTQTLMQTLGGAATGFAVGGPVGAAVGGLAGLMLGLSTNTRKTGKAASAASQAYQTYASSLDDATAALTRNTTAQIQETVRSKHLNDVLGTYGFTNRQIVTAIKNGGPLRQRMVNDLQIELKGYKDTTAAIVAKHGWSSQEYKDYSKSIQARANSVAATLKELGAVDKAVAMKREDIAATRTFSAAIKALPKSTETYIRTNGLKPGISGVVELARQIKLTPDEIRILIKENGGKGTDAQIKAVQDRAAALGKMAPVVNVSAKTGQARSELGAFSTYLASVTRPRTVTITTKHVNAGKPGGVGGLLQQGVGGKSGRFAGGRGSERFMQDSGQRLGEAYGRGVESARMKVKKALDKFGQMASDAADKLANLKEIQAGFLGTFQADNLFGADLSNGGGLGALLDFEQSQASRATRLLADVQKVASMGLSKSLISQLQAQGTAGAEQLHLLAGGSAADIQRFNALDAQTQGALQAAGMLAGNAVRGGNINADVNSAAAEDARLERLLAKLRQLQGDDVVVIQIDSETIIKAIKKRNHRKGVRTAGI
jgi:TP901 family phage tail tape measure protein